ncbi:MAG: methyltransferase domain-containing protein [Ktedonobacteraceae bacterium]
MIYSPETERLVNTIEQQLGRTLAPNVRNAFLQVPRHLFVAHYYRQQGNRLVWDHITAPAPGEISCDEALVTKIDAQGHPISSSSQPSVMARQLELLDLHPGLSVLEIGTGTGYNAALMGALVSSTGQIISIDIDQEHITTASQHVDAVGVTNVLAAVGDGFQGYQEYAPYNRLLATCSVRALPRSWAAQLAPDGILLVNLRLNLSSVFLLLKKVTSTTFEGRLFDLNAAYMEMHGSAGLPQSLQVDWDYYDAQPHYEIQLPANLTKLLTCPAYSVLLECLLPCIRKKYRAFPGENEIHTYLIDISVPGTAIQVQGNHATIIGDQGYLKTQLLQSMEWYERFGVTMEAYSVSFDETGATLCLGEMCFSLEI